MTNPIKKFKDDVLSVTLSDQEKEVLKNEMNVFMRAHPHATKKTHSSFFMPAFFYSGAFAVLFLVGIISQAETSLPGEFFYPVKINVNEPAFMVFAFSEEAKAEKSIELTKRRLNEVVHLIAENRVEKEHIDLIQERVSAYNDDVSSYIRGASEAGDDMSAVEISAEILSVLSANKKVLSTTKEMLGNYRSEIADLGENLSEEESDFITQSLSLDIEGKLDFSSEEERREAQGEVAENLFDAEEALEEALTVLDTQESAIPLHSIQSLIKEGKEQMEEEDFDEAFLLFEKAEQTANEISLIFEAQEIIRQSIKK